MFQRKRRGDFSGEEKENSFRGREGKIFQGKRRGDVPEEEKERYSRGREGEMFHRKRRGDVSEEGKIVQGKRRGDFRGRGDISGEEEGRCSRGREGEISSGERERKIFRASRNEKKARGLNRFVIILQNKERGDISFHLQKKNANKDSRLIIHGS
jgi:hypothetical protein